MDEQQIQQQTLNTEPSQEQTNEQPDVTLDHEGNLEFSDEFIGYEDGGEDYEDHEPEQPEQEQKQEPNLYTQEELQNIPYEQWDKSRLPEEVRAYFDIAAQQYERRAAVERAQNTQVLNIEGEPPKQLTPKELTQQARNLAIQKLGLNDASEFEPEYDEEHRSAMEMARNEVMQRQQNAQAFYNDRVAQKNELAQFNAQIASLPDYNQFNQWYMNTLQKIGKTEAQINSELYGIAVKYGGRAVIQQISEWYRQYKRETSQQQPFNPQPKQRKPRSRPAVLESSRGGDFKKSSGGYDMKAFGNMSSDEQARALMDMGLCNY